MAVLASSICMVVSAQADARTSTVAQDSVTASTQRGDGTVLARVVNLDIAAQPLSSALIALSEQVGVQVIAPGPLVAGHATEGVRGKMPLSDALALLLKGTALVYRLDGNNTIGIGAGPLAQAASASDDHQAPADTAALPAGNTKSSAEHSVQDMGAVRVFAKFTEPLSVGSKSGQSLRETPKSVTLMTRERLEAQNLTSLADALLQSTGVTVAGYSSVESFWMARGFRLTTLQLDGGAPAYSTGYGAWVMPDMAVYDHLEILRGVDGMYTGAGEPGGVINLVRKRAQPDRQIQLNLSAGRWDRYRAEFDATGPLTDDGRLRGRMVVAAEDNGYFHQRSRSDKKLAFGTLEYDLTESILLVAGASHERRKEDNYFIGGLPRYADGRDLGLPRDTAFNPDWSHWYFTSEDVFARIEQRYGSDGVLKLNLTRLSQDSERRDFSVFGSVDPDTLSGPFAVGSAFDFQSVQSLYDLSASGTFSLFGRRHRYTVGSDYAKADGGGTRGYRISPYDWMASPPVDVFAFDPADFPTPIAVPTSYTPVEQQAQNGYYATVGVQLADPLRLTLGGRYGKFRYSQVSHAIDENGALGPASTVHYQDDKFIPSAALTWDFADDWSAYASYAETFKVQANYLSGPRPGTPLSPISGTGLEVGIKGELGGVLNLAAALYRVKRNGEAIRDPNYPIDPGSACCYQQLADVVSEGFDAEISGRVMRGWQLFAGYTYNRSELEGADWVYATYFLNFTPRHSFKAWSTWQLPDALSRWTINLGVTAQSAFFANGIAVNPVTGQEDAYAFTQAGYAIWNASVQYRLSDAWTIGVYADNLFDKRYFISVGDTTGYNVYGTPRSQVLTLRGRW